MVGNDNNKKVHFTDNDITEPINSNEKTQNIQQIKHIYFGIKFNRLIGYAMI